MAKAPDAAAIHGRAKDLMSELKDLTIRVDALRAKCDAKIKPIQNDFNNQIVPLSEQISAKEKALETLATDFRDQIITGEKKSVETPFGTFGFKDTPPALEFVSEEKDIIAAIRKLAKKFAGLWIVTKESVSKTKVKASVTAGDVKPEKLAELGMEMRAGEKFFYKVGTQKL